MKYYILFLQVSAPASGTEIPQTKDYIDTRTRKMFKTIILKKEYIYIYSLVCGNTIQQVIGNISKCSS